MHYSPYRLKHIAYLLNQFIPKLTHPADGLVFLPAEKPFVTDMHSGSSNPATAYEWRKAAGGESEGARVEETELVKWAAKSVGS